MPTAHESVAFPPALGGAIRNAVRAAARNGRIPVRLRQVPRVALPHNAHQVRRSGYHLGADQGALASSVAGFRGLREIVLRSHPSRVPSVPPSRTEAAGEGPQEPAVERGSQQRLARSPERYLAPQRCRYLAAAAPSAVSGDLSSRRSAPVVMPALRAVLTRPQFLGGLGRSHLRALVLLPAFQLPP